MEINVVKDLVPYHFNLVRVLNSVLGLYVRFYELDIETWARAAKQK